MHIDHILIVLARLKQNRLFIPKYTYFQRYSRVWGRRLSGGAELGRAGAAAGPDPRGGRGGAGAEGRGGRVRGGGAAGQLTAVYITSLSSGLISAKFISNLLLQNND